MRDHNQQDQDGQEDDDEFDNRVSKSQLKRDSHALQSLGEELVQLNREQLRNFALPEDLLQAVTLAQSIKAHGAKKRQLQYIGKLMRSIDVDPIKQAMDDLKGISAQSIATQHKIEQWRQRLIDEGDSALETLLSDYPSIDRQRIRQLLRNTKKEAQNNQPPKAFRELFKYLRQYIE